MLAFAFRRAIWAIPTLFGVSLVVFFLTTLMPEPEITVPLDLRARIAIEEIRRTRFLDLPRFFNPAPRDVRGRVEESVGHLVANDASAAYGEATLARLGGAALPYVLPRLDDLPPAERGRVAVALAPIAYRMGVGDPADLTTPDRAALFWSRFWEDRSVDFTEPAVRRTVQRLVKRGGDQLETELHEVDTFALKELFAELRVTRDRAATARITAVLSHVTGREVVVAPNADPAAIRTAVMDWRSWWYVHETDFVPLAGGEKLAASISQTRYAKWMVGAVTGQLGLSTRDGLPILDKLLARAPVTLGMALLALLVSTSVAVPLGVIAAWTQGRTVDHASAGALLLVHSMPTFLVAEVLSAMGGGHGAGFVLPTLALSTVSLSAMTQQQRASMIDALGQDYVRAARAKGARTLRVAIVHALRNALVPIVTLAGVQFPALVGGAFVVEEVFAIRGMGWETLRALESRDVGFVVAVTLLCAVVTTASLVGSDVAYGLLDPRVREAQRGRAA